MQAYERDLIERQDEEKDYSDVSWSVFLDYINAMGKWWLAALVLLIVIVKEVVEMSATWWLSQWCCSIVLISRCTCIFYVH